MLEEPAALPEQDRNKVDLQLVQEAPAAKVHCARDAPWTSTFLSSAACFA
jgi:hypothetical protein